MKLQIYALMLIGMLGFIPLCNAETENGSTSIEEVKKETQDLLQTLNAYSVDQKDEAVQKTRAALNKLDKRIDTLEARIDANWDKMDKAVRKKARENLKAIRKQRNQLAEWYGSLKASSSDAWEYMKKGFADAYKTLNDAWEKSEKEFSSKK